MKLLTPTQSRDARQDELTKQIIRAQEVQEVVKRNNLRLAKSEADFNASLARNRLIWAAEEEHAERLKAREKELSLLDERIKGRQAIEDMQEALEEKLTELADREMQIEMEEKTQQVAKMGIESQRKMMQSGVIPPIK